MAAEALAVDANILVAAMMGGRTRELVIRLRQTGIDLLTPEDVFGEVEEHLPELARYSGARIHQFKIALWTIPVMRVKLEEYQGHLNRATALIRERDSDDAPLLALALARHLPIWTNDRHFKGIPGVQVWTTREVAALARPEA